MQLIARSRKDYLEMMEETTRPKKTAKTGGPPVIDSDKYKRKNPTVGSASKAKRRRRQMREESQLTVRPRPCASRSPMWPRPASRLQHGL